MFSSNFFRFFIQFMSNIGMICAEFFFSLDDLDLPYSLQVELGSTDMALALNRYLCGSVLPLLTKFSALLHDLEDHILLVDCLIQGVYRLSGAFSLTKAQRETAQDCLLALCR